MNLSKDVLAALGSIPPSFPYPPPSHPGTASTAADVHSVAGSPAAPDGSQQAPCGCPLRTATPDPPQILAGATEGDIPQLKELLLSHYASSTFNTCSQQSLPLMHGPPLEFALKRDAVPKAIYTPSVVPRHWEDKIRRDLDRDVAMGVLEKVDVNEPVWSSPGNTTVSPGEPLTSRRLMRPVSVRHTLPCPRFRRSCPSHPGSGCRPRTPLTATIQWLSGSVRHGLTKS